MNGPVRNCPYERIYPISAMGEYTSGGKVDVAKFCRDNNMVCTGFRIQGATDGDGNIVGNVDLTPGGQDDNHHYVLTCLSWWDYNTAVKSIFTANTTATEVYILGINP